MKAGVEGAVALGAGTSAGVEAARRLERGKI